MPELSGVQIPTDAVEKEEPACGTEDSPFLEVVRFKVGDTFLGIVTHVLQPDLINIQAARILDPCNNMEESVNEEFDSFVEMLTKLRANVNTFPYLTNPEVGMPVCGQYSCDDEWYRCEVVQVEQEGSCCVNFVDYGNAEVLPLDRMRVLPQAFLKYPRFAGRYEIYGILPAEGLWNHDQKLYMENTISSNGAAVWVHIEELNTVDPLKAVVTLFSADPRINPHAQIIYEKSLNQAGILYVEHLL